MIPCGAGDLTAGWLSDVLGSTVEELDVQAVGTGQSGSSYRLTPRYAGSTSYPSSFVVKIGAEDPEVRERVGLSYRAEVSFYGEIAPTVRAPIPQCIASDVSEDGTTFFLLLEDLAPAVQGDQILGTTPEVVVAGARALAGLHAPRWCDPTWEDLTVITMGRPTPDGAAGMGSLADMATGIFLDTLGDRMTAEDTETLKAFPAAVPGWLMAKHDRFALLHADYRLDNVMIHPDGRITVVDWATLSIGLPGRDLAYWVSTSLAPEARRAAEHDAVAAYHQALGVDGYDMDECWDDYVLGQLQTPLIATLGWAFTTQTERGAEMMLTMVARSCTALRDLEVL